jgi:hypothetical protein
MSDMVDDFLAREKDGLAGLEDDIPSAFEGRQESGDYDFCKFIDICQSIKVN